MTLSVEVAEIVERFQWLTEGQSSNLPPEKLAEVGEEIGGVMIYLTELAEELGIDPVEAAKAKLERYFRFANEQREIVGSAFIVRCPRHLGKNVGGRREVLSAVPFSSPGRDESMERTVTRGTVCKGRSR